MKRLVTAIAFCGLLAAPLAAVYAGQEKPFFDLENCDMCKNMSAEKGLMDNMKWENHAIDNGLISVTTVAEGYEEAFVRSEKNMQKTGELMMNGKKMDLCGYCQSFSSLMMSGAKMEGVETGAGHIMLVTGDNPELVKKIHAHVKRTNAEMAKMMQGAKDGGHDKHHGQSD